MTSTTTITLARFVAGAFVAAGLAVGGSLGMADVAVADTRPSASENRESKRPSSTAARENAVGLNGNLSQRPATGTRLAQFSHLPFDPAMPGGD